MLNRSRLLLAATAAVLLGGLAPAVSLAQTEVDLTGVKLVVGQTTPTTDAIFAASGAFDDAPYTIEFANFTTPTEQVQALNAGAIDIATLGDTSVTFAQGNANEPWTLESRKFVNIAYRTAGNPDAKGLVAVVRAESDIQSLADLKGKKFAYNTGGTIEALFALVLKSAGLSKADVTPVQLPQSQGYIALINGDVDAWVGGATRSDPDVAAGKVRVIATSADVGQANGLTIAVRPVTLEDPVKAAAVRDWLGRAAEADIWIGKHLDVFARIQVERVNAKYEDAIRSLEDSQGNRFVPIGADVIALQQYQADALHAVGSLASKVDVSIQYDTRFNDTIEATYARLGEASATLPTPGE